MTDKEQDMSNLAINKHHQKQKICASKTATNHTQTIRQH